MSNLETGPDIAMLGPGEPCTSVEVLTPREVPLGGLRAMTVYRTLPQRGRSLVGAWCFLDHYGPDDVSITGGMNVSRHPHTGLARPQAQKSLTPLVQHFNQGFFPRNTQAGQAQNNRFIHGWSRNFNLLLKFGFHPHPPH